MIKQTWICTISEGFNVNYSFSSSIVLEKIFKWPHPIFVIISPLKKTWPFTWRNLNSLYLIVPRLNEFGSVVLEIDYLVFYVPLKNISLIWRRHHCWWRAAKFRPMLRVQGLWAGRDLYRATPVVTRDFGFSGLIQRTAPFNCLLRHTRGSGRPILTRILMGRFWRRFLKKKISVYFYSFAIISPGEGCPPSFEHSWILFPQRWYVISLVKIGLVVFEKIFKWPNPIFTFLWLSPPWKVPGPLSEKKNLN
jgi:hypothetical protein